MVKIIEFRKEYQEKTKDMIINILVNEFNFEKYRPDLLDIKKTYQGKDKDNFWIAVDKNAEIVGSICIKDVQGYGYIKRMYVVKRLRRKGIASKLFSALLAFAKEKGYSELYLATNETMTAAQQFYERNGFKRIEKLPECLPDEGDTLFYMLNIQ
ncbi:GNAT family N-acetyltransferase [Candidatus Woesearchaeota archaeon]|nr:GNAT family N-acetyltransferase [Candidatus Woesearchaeota archaeon]